MAAKANTSSNSIIFSSDDEGRVSDSDSTDYEPEPKKCKVEDSKEGGNSLLASDSLVTIPIRAATSVVEYNTQNVQGERGANGATRREGEGSNSGGSSHLGGESGSRRAYLSVASLVEQTLEAALGPPSDSQPMSQDLFSDEVDPRNRNLSQEIAANPPISYGGDFPTIAREVVIRTVGRSSLATQDRHSRSRRRRRRLHTPNPENINTAEDDVHSGSSDIDSGTPTISSASSSEYFTDDVDPEEIPSDEYLSPPLPTLARRNAIFVRREPPASVLNDDDQYYHNELEVASVLDINENPIEDGSSTSAIDDEVRRRSLSPAVSILPTRAETDNNFADSENAKSEAESEPAPASVSNSNENNASGSDEREKSLCTQCNALKAGPYFRHCLRCFKIRRQWLPARPASRRLKTRKALMRSGNANSLNNSRATRSSDSSDDVVDGGHVGLPNSSESTTGVDRTVNPSLSSQVQESLPSSQRVDLNDGFMIDESNPSANRVIPGSQTGNLTLIELFTPPENPSRSTSHPGDTNAIGDSQSQSQSGSSYSQSQSQSGSSSSQSQRSLLSLNSQNSYGTQSSSPPSQPQLSSSPIANRRNSSDVVTSLSTMCSICFVREKDSAFVHNKIAHLYCCYNCADKILKKDGKCPICRERVLRVVKIISV